MTATAPEIYASKLYNVTKGVTENNNTGIDFVIWFEENITISCHKQLTKPRKRTLFHSLKNKKVQCGEISSNFYWLAQ